MKHVAFRHVAVFLGLFLTAGGGARAQPAAPSTSGGAAAEKPLLSLQMPALPAPVAVTLKPATTALIVADMVERTCGTQPRCTSEMVPNIAQLLARARQAGVFVIYSVPPPGTAPVLPAVAPASGDPIIAAKAQDRFYDTDLDKMLKARGITTLILTGWKINGSVLYTSVTATLHGYTVVVPVDASLAATDYDVAIGHYQILTQLSANATNEPLKPKASTLSRTDMITFQ